MNDDVSSADDKRRPGEKLLREEPTFDEDEGLDDYDKTLADSFPASDPPEQP